MNTRKEILEMLVELLPGVEIESQTALFDDGILKSFTVIAFIEDLREEYDIDLGMEDLIPENFNSLDSIVAMVDGKL
jgi:acyl carrier protein